MNENKHDIDVNADKQFNYTYTALSADERRNVISIRSEYEPISDKQTKLARLQALDKKAKTLPKSILIIMIIAGVLVMGLGMSMFMAWDILGGGIVVGLLGVAVAALAYPIYKKLLKWSKGNVSLEVLALSKELLLEKHDKINQ